jgi:hypothetical protein
MASIDSLSPDQRAVLELVLRRGRSYDEIAQLLSIDRAGVRQRALAAFDALGPQTRIPAERRALITDYLLGGLPDRVAQDVREHLSKSASERAWARAVASELAGLSQRPLPEIPAEASPMTATTPTEPPHPPSSRLGGAVVLAAGAAVVVAVVLVLVLSDSGSPKPSRHAARTSPATSTRTTATTGAQIVAKISLLPPTGAKTPVGIAEVLRAQGQVGVAIAAQGLAANTKHPPNAYAVWLYNSPTDSHILGFVSPAVGSSGQLKTAGGLPSNASHYRKLLVTLETRSGPRTPGRIVLQGPLSGL